MSSSVNHRGPRPENGSRERSPSFLGLGAHGQPTPKTSDQYGLSTDLSYGGGRVEQPHPPGHGPLEQVSSLWVSAVTSVLRVESWPVASAQ